jgi:NDP-hexose C3-ketoreductase / dTDP-4-oxo-2-deoxy-alpha-D-pentos-2-ene 2,3-reductase
VVLASLFANPVVSAPIIGPRSVEQLNESLWALELTLSSETLKRLDQI